MKTAAKPYKIRGMVKVARTRANFYVIFLRRGIGSITMGERDFCRATASMRVPASQFGRSLTLPVESNSREVARTQVNSRELLKGHNQWPNPTKYEGSLKSRELARTLTPFFAMGTSPSSDHGSHSCRFVRKRNDAMFWGRVLKLQNWPIRRLYGGRDT